MNTWRGKVDLGLVQYAAYVETIAGAGPVVESLRETLSDSSFSILDITHAKDPDARRECVALLRDSGIRVAFSGNPPLAFGGFNLSSTEVSVRDLAVKRAKQLIDEAIAAGAEIAYFISGPDPGPDSRKRAYESLLDSMVCLCSYASDHSAGKRLVVGIEPGDRSVQHKQLLGPTEDAVWLAREIRRDHGNFGLVIDQSHIQQLGETPQAVIAQCAPFTHHFHLANAVVDDLAHPLYGDQHPAFGIPGGRVGVEDIAEFVKLVLSSKVWDGAAVPSLSLEVKSRNGENPRAVVEEAKAAFAAAWAKSGCD